MNFNYDLSVLVPGVRNENWETVRDHLTWGCSKYKYEIIFCSPYALPASLQSAKNIKYIKDFGTPTRALHLASLLAEGRFMMWMVDDGHIYPDSIDKAIDMLLSMNPDKDIVGLRYCEGVNHSGNEHTHPISYANVTTHPDLQAPKVDRSWIAPGVQLMSTAYYHYLGGFDCRFEHTNMNLYDFAFRAKMNGSNVVMTPHLVINCDIEPNRDTVNSQVIAAFWENDRPLYWKIYGEDAPPREIRIDPNGEMSWRNCDVVWKRKKY